MVTPKRSSPAKKDRHALQKLLGATALMAAAYAAGKVIETKKKRKVVKKEEVDEDAELE